MFNSKIRCSRRLGNVLRPGRALLIFSPGQRPQTIAPGGPFGVNQQQPFVERPVLSRIRSPGTYATMQPRRSRTLGRYATSWRLLRTATPRHDHSPTTAGGNHSAGSSRMRGIKLRAMHPFYLGGYNARNNKLPYTMNTTLDIQWQPRNDWRSISAL